MSTWRWVLLLGTGVAGYLVMGFGHGHAHAWEAVPLFYGLFGLVGCALIVFASKLVGRLLLDRREDYYDDG